MCDQESVNDMIEYQLRSTRLSRRHFGALTLSAGVASVLTPAAHAAWIDESDVEVPTPDGTADAYFVHPSQGVYPGVLMWPDIYGLRPAFRQMGRRLAESGYSVLVVNPFYRTKRAPVVPEHADYNDPATRTTLTSLMGTLNPQTVVTDSKAFVAWLDVQSSVDRKRRIGTLGYCMSGPYTMRAAAALPERIGAGASFHGGALVTDKPDSPHLLVQRMRAEFLFAIAENDDQRQPDVKNVLREAFARARLPAEIEVYAGAVHGWCPVDSRGYNDQQAERAWSRLLVLFKHALAQPVASAA